VISTVILLPLSLVLPIFLCVVYLRRARAAKANYRLQYSISDIWALMLGLTPTLLFVQAYQNEIPEFGVALLLGMTLPSQIAGAFVAHVTETAGLTHNPVYKFPQFVSVFLGALTGYALLIANLIMSFIIFYLILLTIFTFPYCLGVPILVFLIVSFRASRTKSPPPLAPMISLQRAAESATSDQTALQPGAAIPPASDNSPPVE
jgi:hypothetical protein